MKSAAATARIAMSARSYRTMWLSAQSVKAFERMRSIRTTPRRSGRRARNWSESLFELKGEKRNERNDESRWQLYLRGHVADCKPCRLWGHATRRAGWRQAGLGPATRYSRCDRGSSRGSRVGSEPHRYQRFLRSAYN